jgi:hypothetical protein
MVADEISTIKTDSTDSPPWRNRPQWAKFSSWLRLHDHTQTHYTRKDSSGRVIRPRQGHLLDNTQHIRETTMLPAGFEPAISARFRDSIRPVFFDSVRNVRRTIIYLVVVNCIINNFLTSPMLFSVWQYQQYSLCCMFSSGWFPSVWIL